MRLTCYLFKPEISDFQDAFILQKLEGDECYIDVTPSNITTNFTYKVYIQKNKQKSPKWLKFIQQYTEIPNPGELLNQVNSFVILIKIDSRIFGISGGHGFHVLDRNKIEPNFGLITTLNALDPSQIKFLDAKNIDVNTRQKRIISASATDIKDFGLDFDLDLLRMVSRIPSDQSLGKTLKGSDSLTLSPKDLKFEILGEKCSALLKYFSLKRYERNFNFINNILPVKDNPTLDLLDEKLINAINYRKADSRILICYPDQFEYEQYDYLKIKSPHKAWSEPHEFILLENVYAYLDDISLTLDEIKKDIHIVGFDNEDNPLSSKISLYSFFSFETELNNALYVLTEKQWFKINQNYLNEVQNYLSKLPYSETYLPPHQGENEETYNKICATKKGFILLDKLLVPVPGTIGPIEICDLFDPVHNRLIHIKKDRGSATLSHLFAQGSISADLLAFEQAFQNGFLLKTGLSTLPEIKAFTIVFGIITNKKDNLVAELPIFSKIHLMHHTKQIQRLKYNVEIVKVTTPSK